MMTSIALLGLISAMDESEVDLVLNPSLEPCGSMEVGELMPVLPSGGGFHYDTGTGMSSPLLPTGVPPPFPLLPTPVSLVADDAFARASPSCPVPVNTAVSPPLRYLALFAVICYETAYSFGLGPLTWLLLAEIFPASVKGRAVWLSTSLHWFADLIIPATSTDFISKYITSHKYLFVK
jgi:hypothetical protein